MNRSVCLIFVGIALGWLGVVDGEQNLLNNPDFETNVNSVSDWLIFKADVAYSDDAKNGARSILIANRTHRFGGVKQKVYSVERNTTYYMSAYFKTLENSTSSLYYKIRLWVKFQFTSGASPATTHFGRLPNLRASNRWRKLGGDFTSPDEDMSYMEMCFEMDSTISSYQLDSASLSRIDPDPLWREKAKSDIAKYRTNSVKIRGQFPDTFPYCRCRIQVNQTRSDFGFGSAIQPDRFIENTAAGDIIRKFHYDHFNWAVFGNGMKWKPMENVKDQISFERLDSAMDLLEANNMTIRGHSMLWSLQGGNPDWVQSLEGDDLMAEVNRRLEYLLGRYKGKIAQWDAVNEWLHSTFYDDATNNPLFQDAVFNKAREIDTTGELYINDYQGLKDGDYTSAFVDQVEELISHGVRVDGIAVQSHLRSYVDPVILKKRLDVIGAGGFPIVLSEVSVHDTDVNARAAHLDEALLVYFSNPAVKAIIFWFVSDQDRMGFEPAETVLFQGEQFQPNVAGQVFLDRRAEWQTHTEFVPETRSFHNTIDAFHGSYEVNLYCMDHLVMTDKFYLNPGANITVNLDLMNTRYPCIDPALNDCDVT